MSKKLCLIFLFLFLFESSSALGISPGRIIVDFKPNLKSEIELYIVNSNEQKSFEIDLYVRGDLKDNITLSTEHETINANDIKPFKIKLDLPAEIKPGLHDNRIGIIQSTSNSNEQISTKIAVESQLWIKAPYPGLYIEPEFTTEYLAVDKNGTFTLKIFNAGQVNISKISGYITIYENGNEVATIPFDELNDLTISEDGIIYIRIDPKKFGLASGIYEAVAHINYDKDFQELKSSFRIGDLLVNLNDIKPTKISLGAINKLVFNISSIWNYEIKGIIIILEIFKENKLIETIRSETISLGAWETKILPLYIDASNLAIGEYIAKATLYFEDKSVERMFTIEVVGWQLFTVQIVIVVLLVLAVAIIIYFIMLEKKTKKKAKRKKRKRKRKKRKEKRRASR